MPDSRTRRLEAASKRAARRRSPWNLVLLAIAALGIAGSWFGIAVLWRAYRQSLFPADAFLSSGTRFGDILMYVPPCFPSIALGLLVANLLLWCIPPARLPLSNQAAVSPRADFRSSNAVLMKALIILMVFTLPICFLGARNFWSLSPERVVYQPMFSRQPRTLRWSGVREIRTACYARRHVEHNFVLRFEDGTSLDLAEETPLEFLAAYPEIQRALSSAKYDFEDSGVIGQCSLSQAWARVLMERPTAAAP